MAWDRIENLLEKYFEAATSITEERELKDYFASSDVAPHLEQYKPVFGYATQAKQEQCSATLPLTAGRQDKKRNIAVWLSVAASVIVLVSVGIFTYNHDNSSKLEDLGTYDDPEIAYKETQKALSMIALHLNKGVESINYIKEYQQSKNKIFK